jgi:hypothetical protein
MDNTRQLSERTNHQGRRDFATRPSGKNIDQNAVKKGTTPVDEFAKPRAREITLADHYGKDNPGLPGGVPKQSDRGKLIQEAMERMGHNYADFLSGRIKANAHNNCTEEEVAAISCYIKLSRRIKSQEKAGIVPTVENISTDFVKKSTTLEARIIYSHMSQEEEDAQKAYYKKTKDRVEATQVEKDAHSKYNRLSNLLKQRKLALNEAGSSQQDAGPQEDRLDFDEVGHSSSEGDSFELSPVTSQERRDYEEAQKASSDLDDSITQEIRKRKRS